jgi:hypothetical protein
MPVGDSPGQDGGLTFQYSDGIVPIQTFECLHIARPTCNIKIEFILGLEGGVLTQPLFNEGDIVV